MEELSDKTTPKQHGVAPKVHEDQGDPEKPNKSYDINYIPPSEEEDSLEPRDFIIPEDPLDQDRFKRQLIATV